MNGQVVTLTMPGLRAGALHRRTVRYAVRAARALGADVRVTERWTLLDSIFTIRADGTERQVAPLVNLARAVQSREVAA